MTNNRREAPAHGATTLTDHLRDIFGPGHHCELLPDENPEEPWPVAVVTGPLLHHDGALVTVCIAPAHDGFALDDCGDGASRHASPGIIASPDCEHGPAVAAAWDVAFAKGALRAHCAADAVVDTAYRIMMASLSLAHPWTDDSVWERGGGPWFAADASRIEAVIVRNRHIQGCSTCATAGFPCPTFDALAYHISRDTATNCRTCYGVGAFPSATPPAFAAACRCSSRP